MKIKYVILTVLAVVIALSLGFYLLLKQERAGLVAEKEAFTKAQTEAMQEELAMLAEEYKMQYNKIKVGDGENSFEIGTDSLVAQLLNERAKVDRLQNELKNTKAASAERIAALTREVSTLRKVLRTYVVQIDSLQATNERLRAENASVKESYNKSQSTVQQLSSEKSELTSRVNLAAKLDATAISVLPMDKKGKQAKKIDKIVNLQISFHVAKNVTAAVGKKTFYIRLTRPDEEVMLKGNSGNFSFEGKSIPYSIRREIEYNGEETAVSMYWPVEESLQSGTYKLRIFADGNLIGSGSFRL